MNLLILLIKSVLSWNKQSQLIRINPGLLIITVLPDKASLIPVLSNRSIPDHSLILINRIHIKQKNPLRIQIIIYQGKHMLQLLFLCYVIQTVTHAYHSPYGSIKFKLLHILKKIQDVMPGLYPLLHGLCQHFPGIIHSDHVIASLCQYLSHGSRAAAKIQHKSVCDSLRCKLLLQPFAPGLVVHIVLEHIIYSGKFAISLKIIHIPSNCHGHSHPSRVAVSV